MRYIESAASYCLRDGLRAEARRQIIGAALELGAHGLTRRGDAAVLAERVEMDELMLTAELTRAQRFVIVGLRRGVEREVLCEMLGVTMETVREYERDGITKLREARR